MLDPDHGNLFPPGFLDEAADVRNDRVAVVISRDDALLDVDDEEGGVRAVLECAHGLPSFRLAHVPSTVDKTAPNKEDPRLRLRGSIPFLGCSTSLR